MVVRFAVINFNFLSCYLLVSSIGKDATYSNKIKNNVAYTSQAYGQAFHGMSENTIIKTQGFLQNYARFLAQDIISIHWTQEHATVFPAIVLQNTITLYL